MFVGETKLDVDDEELDSDRETTFPLETALLDMALLETTLLDMELLEMALLDMESLETELLMIEMVEESGLVL